ncbi:MAG: MBL fold metallo-hydrolase [Actinomycetota bacterium]
MAELGQMPTILRLDLAVVGLPESHPAAQVDGELPVYGYCIAHPDGPILVDTGVGFGNDIIDELYHPQREILGELLDRSGVDPGAVVAVVNSHLHFDHCGQNPSLFNSPTVFLAQAAEYETVAGDAFYTDASWALAPEHQRRIVNGDEPLAEGVTILATPGHTAGHQSVLIEAEGRRVVIGGQMVWRTEELVGEVASVENVDPDPALQEAAVDSIRRIKALNPEIVHLSHCAAFQPHR